MLHTSIGDRHPFRSPQDTAIKTNILTRKISISSSMPQGMGYFNFLLLYSKSVNLNTNQLLRFVRSDDNVNKTTCFMVQISYEVLPGLFFVHLLFSIQAFNSFKDKNEFLVFQSYTGFFFSLTEFFDFVHKNKPAYNIPLQDSCLAQNEQTTPL